MNLKQKFFPYRDPSEEEGDNSDLAFRYKDVKEAVLLFWKEMSQDERIFSVTRINYIEKKMKEIFGDWEE